MQVSLNILDDLGQPLRQNFVSEIATEVPGGVKYEIPEEEPDPMENFQELFQVSWNSSLILNVWKGWEWISRFYFFGKSYCQAVDPIVNKGSVCLLFFI